MNQTPINCACVIHSNAYDWTYVDRLHSMLSRNLSRPIKLHVWTEASRLVPDHMIKHTLEEWPGVAGPRRSWWYKMQMFNPDTFPGQLLYFDLDTVLVKSIDWILDCSPRYFWSIRDFKYLQRPDWQGMNSSVMYWDNTAHPYIWKQFLDNDPMEIIRRYPGDQDFLTEVVPTVNLRFFNESLVQSWRWQVNDGGMDLRTRTVRLPDAGAILDENVSIVVFHGRPKPHDVQDHKIVQHWI